MRSVERARGALFSLFVPSDSISTNGVPSISAVPDAGNPGNPQGPWKWLRALYKIDNCWAFVGFPGNLQGPWKWLLQKERTLQNRQLLGFCGVPSISAVLEAGNPRNPQGALEMVSAKSADSTTFREAGNPGNPQGPWKWLPEKERALQNQQLLGFCGVPSISAVPEAANPGHPQGLWKWLPEKERALQNRQLLGFCGVRRSQKLVIQQIYRGLGSGPDSTQSTCFGPFGVPSISAVRQLLGFCGVPSISAVPEAANPGHPQGLWKWLPEKERALQNRQLLGFCGVRRSQKLVILEVARTLHNQHVLGLLGFPPFRRSDNFWAFVGLPPFQKSQKPEIQQMHVALEMAPEKEWALRKHRLLLWSSPHFGGPRLGILISSMSKLRIKCAKTQ